MQLDEIKMYSYTVGYFESIFGRRTITVEAKNRAQAMNIAFGMGFTVIDCDYNDNDE